MRGEILSANSKSLQIRKIILSIIFALLTVISLCMAGCKQESGNKPVPGPVVPIDPDIPDDPENPETKKIEINDVNAVVSLADAAVSEYFTASTEAEQIAALGKYASISDEKGGKSVRFSWKGNGSVKYTLYLADNERFENAKEYVASGLENELCVYNLVPSSAYYWKVCGTFDGDESVTSHFTTESISLRCVFVDGAVNTRDIGGYAAANGSVNYGKIYRGGSLDSITNAGAETLKNDLKIKTEIDLRKDGAQKTDRLGLSYYKFDAGSYTDILDLAAWNALPAAARREFNAKYSAGIKNIFEILANEENYPVYIHCDNGADETGTVAFLINALLGVSESDLIRDFELSSFSAAAGARYRSALNADKTGFADSGVMKNDKTAFVAFGATIDAMKTAYGATDKSLAYAVENYLTDYVGVTHTDVEKIKKIMLSSYTPSDVIYLDGERQVIEVSKPDNEINLGDTAYETVEGVYLGGNKIGDSISLIDGANLSGVYGERELTVVLNTENGRKIVKVPVLVVTKYIRNAEDLTTSLKISDNGNFGYYELKNDITLDSLSNGAAKVAFDGSNGFRGIFEGKGHTITSVLGDHGLFGFVGNGAIIRNVKFDISGSVNVMNKTIIADYVLGARIENVTINVATESAEFGADAGLVTSAAFNGNTVTGLIVNAKKAAVNSLFGGGKYLFDKNEFDSCFVNVKNIKELARNYVNGNYVSVYLEDASGFGGEITDVIDISVADVINVKGANIELNVGERFANTNVAKVVCNGIEIKERKFENGILYLFNDFAVFGENLGKTVINVTFEADNGIIVETKLGVVAFTDSEEVEFDETQEIFINRAENSIDLKNYAGSTVYSISVAGYYLGNDVNSLDIGDELKENKAQHGRQIMSVLLGNDGGYYTVYIPVTVVTAEISDISQLNAIMASDSTEYAIHGYYKLVADVGKSSDNLNNGNDVNWENDDGLYGFRGTLDGNGHSITATVLQKGTFGIVGSGAVIKNLTINAYGFANGRTVLARSIRSATVENVTINIESGESTSYLTEGGVITALMSHSTLYKNVTINSKGAVDTLFGCNYWHYDKRKANTFENVNVNVKSIGGLSCLRANVAESLDPIDGVEGITVSLVRVVNDDNNVYLIGENGAELSLGEGNADVTEISSVKLGDRDVEFDFADGKFTLIERLTVDDAGAKTFTLYGFAGDKKVIIYLSVTVSLPAEEVILDGTREVVLSDATQYAVDLGEYADGNVINATFAGADATYANGKLTLTAAFKTDTQKHGNQTLVVTLEKGGKYYAVNVKVLVVTKEITNLDELKEAVTIDESGVKYGYYRLKNSLGNSNTWINYGNVSKWNVNDGSYGFRGTFDGCGNGISAVFFSTGLFGTLGNGAVVQNVTFTHVHEVNRMILGYNMIGTTLKNVKVNVTGVGATTISTDASGLLTAIYSHSSRLINVDISSPGTDIDTLFGSCIYYSYSADYTPNVFENCTIKAKSLLGLACIDKTTKAVLPYTGVSGLTVTIG